MQPNKYTPWAQLSTLITTSLDAVRVGEFSSIAQALKPAIPEVIESLKTIAADPTTTTPQRINCIELLMTMWARCLRGDLRTQKVEVAKLQKAAQRDAAAAERARAQAADKKLTLATAKEQKRIARRLAKLRGTNVETK